MSRQSIASLESQLSSANHELELATFLNKGILQTNTEYKLRIAELEAENLILRKAESRLSRTEDKLEKSERDLEKVLSEKIDHENEKDGLIKEKNRLKKEKEDWEHKYWSLIGKIEGLYEDVPKFPQLNENDKMKRKRNGLIGGSVNKSSTKEESVTPITKTRPPASGSKRRSLPHPSIHEPSAQPIASTSKISLSPVRPPTRAQSKKRRRVEDSDSDSDDQGFNEEASIDGEESGDPLSGSYSHNSQITPPQPRSTPRSRPASTTISTSKQKRASGNANTNANVKSRESGKQPAIVFTVKDEPLSPGGGGSDSDSDPLAMV
ncbi:uncharacterized protein IL334_007264 [Kwoniella shivajii]|uniref:Shugoshin C-terminal domain-containing protein n=1 Tax=Kwoniella shivajii TaxID=564305 RepID=A0ABZ1D869_9TREE|nr:hypothetical protein IL334_007264 [Kwoniella shivajii]